MLNFIQYIRASEVVDNLISILHLFPIPLASSKNACHNSNNPIKRTRSPRQFKGENTNRIRNQCMGFLLSCLPYCMCVNTIGISSTFSQGLPSVRESCLRYPCGCVVVNFLCCQSFRCISSPTTIVAFVLSLSV